MHYLTLKNVAKSYGKTHVLRQIDLVVEQGEFVVLVGPSGCGKSTLLRTIAGLESASAGDILIGDTRVNDVPPRERDVAMVFQNYALYPHLTVRENLGFALKMRSTDPGLIAERAQEVARMLGLEALLDRLPKQLSGGQRQRVAMGRAIMRKPKLFLFDEPLSNLGAKLRVQMRTEIAQLHRRLGATSIFVTHDQVEAMTMADRIVLLQDGVIRQVGSPRDLYHAPVNRFVATFIGSPAMNMIEVRPDAVGGLDQAEDHLFDSTMVPDGRACTLGLRPETMRLCAPESALWRAEVISIEDLGYQAFVYLRGEHGQALCVLVAMDTVPRIGDLVGVRAELSAAHLFDAQGQRLVPAA